MKTIFKTLFVMCVMICISQFVVAQKTASKKQKVANFSRDGESVKLTYNSDSTMVLKMSYLENKIWNDFELLDYTTSEANGFVYTVKKKNGKIFTAEFISIEDAIILMEVGKEGNIALLRTTMN